MNRNRFYEQLYEPKMKQSLITGDIQSTFPHKCAVKRRDPIAVRLWLNEQHLKPYSSNGLTADYHALRKYSVIMFKNENHAVLFNLTFN